MPFDHRAHGIDDEHRAHVRVPKGGDGGVSEAEPTDDDSRSPVGEIGQPEEPAASAEQQRELAHIAAPLGAGGNVTPEEMQAREMADRSSAFPAFVLIACAVGLPLGAVLLVALIVISSLRRGREAKDARK